MIAATIDRIRRACRPAHQPAAASFRELALSMAKGIEPDPAEAALVLRACDRTPEQLAAEVERLRQRLEAIRRLGVAEIAQRDRSAVEAALARINQEEAEAVRRARAEREPLLIRRAKLTDSVAQGLHARRLLQETLSEDQRQDLADLDAEARPLREQVARLEAAVGGGSGTIGGAIGKLTTQIEAARNAIQRIPQAEAKERARRSLAEEEHKLARFNEQLEEHQTRLAQLRQQLRELDERRDAILQDALTNP